MKEEFLHFLWKFGLYDPGSLLDNNGKQIIVLNPGEHNHDSGPDFFNARILIDDTEWAGNVEIHLSASHFDTHGHNRDHAYDNVILHVVGVYDKDVFNARGEKLLTAKIGYDESLYQKYCDLLSCPGNIACRDEISNTDSFLIRHWLSSLVIERLQAKSSLILNIFAETGNDWDETFYRLLTRYFGFRINAEPFEMLATALPFRIIRKHADNRFQIESLLFGSAGMLEETLFREAVSDEYFNNLLKEYRILAAKYSLRPVHGWLWKFHRLRPVNFPTVRISQLSAMLQTAGGLFSRTMEARDLRTLRGMFEVSASDYWSDHYVFGKRSAGACKNTGSQAADILLINAVIPLVFVYGKFRNQPVLCERALSFLEEIRPEENVIVNEWNSCGFQAESAFYTQGLLQLTNEYCKRRRCLDCRIGGILVSMGKKSTRVISLFADVDYTISIRFVDNYLLNVELYYRLTQPTRLFLRLYYRKWKQ